MAELFDYLNSINETKEYLLNEENENKYPSFMVNRGLSYFPDTIMYANEINLHYIIDNKLQYDYLINNVRTRKRRSKWAKKIKDNDVNSVMEYYDYSRSKAETALSILSPKQLEIIKKKLEKGGIKK